MQCEMTINCYNVCATVEPVRAPRGNGNAASRLRTFAISLLVIVMMLYGGWFALQQRSASTEFAAATYVFDSGVPAKPAAKAVRTGSVSSRGAHR